LRRSEIDLMGRPLFWLAFGIPVRPNQVKALYREMTDERPCLG
jgi:hypothetical protein